MLIPPLPNNNRNPKPANSTPSIKRASVGEKRSRKCSLEDKSQTFARWADTVINSERLAYFRIFSSTCLFFTLSLLNYSSIRAIKLYETETVISLLCASVEVESEFLSSARYTW